jgi:hypothetical protein
LCALALAAGCATGPAPLRAPTRAAAAPGELRVELVFGAGSDLDLYVTDPAQETVYFANTPARGSAGRLEADLRCDAATLPRIETIVFESAPAGRYRVGVDRAQTCDAGGSAAEPFLVVVEFAGLRREVRGEILGERFLPKLLEIDLPERKR